MWGKVTLALHTLRGLRNQDKARVAVVPYISISHQPNMFLSLNNMRYALFHTFTNRVLGDWGNTYIYKGKISRVGFTPCCCTAH